MHCCWLMEQDWFYLPQSLKVVVTKMGCFGFGNCYMWIMSQTNQFFNKHWSGGNDLTCITGSFYLIHLNTSSLYTKESSGINKVAYVSAKTMLKSLQFTELKKESYSDSLISVVNVYSIFFPWYGWFRMPTRRLTLQDCRLSCCHDHICGVLSEVIT